MYVVLKESATNHCQHGLNTRRINPFNHPIKSMVHNSLHYYSFFGLCGQCDIVVTMASDNRFEVEQRYTGYVSLTSRATLPRIDMRALATQLNEMETSPGMKWSANRYVDSGPMLSLYDENDRRLTKAER
jgi:hypothetical protein